LVRTLTIVLVLVAGAGTAVGQFRGLGFIRGKIVDQNGAPLAGVTFTATLPNTSGGLTGISDNNGEWRMIGLTHGAWKIVFQKPGYAPGQAKIVLDTELDRIPALTIKMKATERTN